MTSASEYCVEDSHNSKWVSGQSSSAWEGVARRIRRGLFRASTRSRPSRTTFHVLGSRSDFAFGAEHSSGPREVAGRAPPPRFAYARGRTASRHVGALPSGHTGVFYRTYFTLTYGRAVGRKFVRKFVFGSRRPDPLLAALLAVRLASTGTVEVNTKRYGIGKCLWA